MKIMHIITQNGQPYGSQRRCCEECGKSRYALAKNDRYVETREEYSREFADEKDLIRCCDNNTAPKPVAIVGWNDRDLERCGETWIDGKRQTP